MRAAVIHRGLPLPDPEDAELLVEMGVRKLGASHQKSLRYHLAVGTPILAGPDVWDWVLGGAAGVAVLAVTRELPPKDVLMLDPGPPGAPDALKMLGGARHLGAMSVLTQDQARAAVVRGLARP